MWFILIIAIITAIVAVIEIGRAAYEATDSKYYNFKFYYEGTGTIILTCILIIALLIIPLSRRNINVHLNSFEAKRETLSALRGEGGFETAASLSDVMEANAWLADGKWIQSHKGFNWYVPKEIQNVKPIQ